MVLHFEFLFDVCIILCVTYAVAWWVSMVQVDYIHLDLLHHSIL